MKKKFVSAAVVLACLLAFTACGAKQESAAPAEKPAEATAAEEPKDEQAEPETQEEQTGAETEEAAPEAAEDVPGEAGTTTIANPWKDFETAEEAAQFAGIDPLTIPEMEIDLGPVDPFAFRSMDSLEETIVEFPAVEMTIRKGVGFEDGDCSGDYTEYAHEWTQDVNGLEVKCFGNDEGRSTKTIWAVDGVSYSIFVEGLGGDENYGLSSDSVNSLVSGIQ